jgi:hypothetical protein
MLYIVMFIKFISLLCVQFDFSIKTYLMLGLINTEAHESKN